MVSGNNRSLRRRTSSNSVNSADANVKKSTSNMSLSVRDDSPNYEDTMESVPLDIGAFDGEKFDERAYLYSILIKQKIGEETLKSLAAHLAETKEKTGKHLKKSFFRHYNEFVSIAKEITLFETDMIAIKALMKDIQTSMAILNEEVFDTRREANQESAFTTLLSSNSDNKDIFKNSLVRESNLDSNIVRKIADEIEGSQKYHLVGSDRALLHEGEVSEFSFDSMKATKLLHFYLFNDCLLIAQKKRKMAYSSKYKLTAEMCLSLAEISVGDLKDDEESKNLFKIRSSLETFAYQAFNPESKSVWIKTINDAIFEVKKSLTSPEEDSKKTQNDEEASIMPTYKRHLSAVALTNAQDSLTSSQINSINESFDDLDVYVAHGLYDQGIETYLKIKSMIENQPPEASRIIVFMSHLKERIERISFFIGQEMSKPFVTKSQTHSHIKQLIKLGLSEKAREIFLESRERIIQELLRDLRVGGNIVDLTSERGYIVSQIIRNTGECYSDFFSDAKMSSGFVFWAKQEIASLVKDAKRQIFCSPDSYKFPEICQTLGQLRNNCKSLFKVGVNLLFMVDEMLMRDILEVSEIQLQKLKKKMVTFASIESFDYPLIPKKGHPKESGKNGGEDSFQTVNISGYARNSGDLVISFMDDLFRVINSQLHQYFVKSVVSLISHCGDTLGKIVESRGQLSDRQYFNLMNDLRFLWDSFTPRRRLQISQKLGKSFPEFEVLVKDLEDHHAKIEISYLSRRPISLLAEVNYDRCDYSIDRDLDNSAAPSLWVKTLIKTLNSISSDLDPKVNREKILDGLLLGISFKLDERFKGGISSVLKPFGFGGIQQYLLDIRFLTNVCQSFLATKTDDSYLDLCKKAIKAFSKENKEKAKQIKDNAWFDDRIKGSLVQLGGEFENFGRSL